MRFECYEQRQQPKYCPGGAVLPGHSQPNFVAFRSFFETSVVILSPRRCNSSLPETQFWRLLPMRGSEQSHRETTCGTLLVVYGLRSVPVFFPSTLFPWRDGTMWSLACLCECGSQNPKG